MAREIKFRAWVKNENGDYMSPVGGIDFKSNSIMVYVPKPTANDDVDWDGDAVDGENIILMQFTGLKDKNGKEIYEGDVLGGIFGGPQYVGWCDKCASFNMIMNCIKDYGPCMQCEGDIPWIDIAHEERKTLEVIGNIYEQPELITP